MASDGARLAASRRPAGDDATRELVALARPIFPAVSMEYMNVPQGGVTEPLVYSWLLQVAVTRPALRAKLAAFAARYPAQVAEWALAGEETW